MSPDIRQVWLRRVPRHVVRARGPAILPRLPHLRDRGLHIRERDRVLPELRHFMPEAAKGTTKHGDRARPEDERGHIGLLLPKL